MKSFTKDDHVRAILEYYKAGYITTAEKDKLVAELYKEFYTGALSVLLDIKVEERDIAYLYTYDRLLSHNAVKLFVNDDFYIRQIVDKHSFTVREL